MTNAQITPAANIAVHAPADQPTDHAGNPVCRNCGVAHYMHLWVTNDCHSIA